MRDIIKFCFIIYLSVALTTAAAKSELLIKTRNGIVKGYTQQTRQGNELLAFTGIKFAEAPVGENRFLPPAPAKSWTGIYDATHEGPLCPQTTDDWSNVSEDCLWLNVITKNLTAEQPVLVWIFGGALVEGSATYDPQYILDRADLVFVSVQYRLGPFGFFSTGDANAPGNAGFKDQTLALKWVRDNIRAFGGNPDLVTIFGQSAGALSVSAHLVSPLSNGLFKHAVADSGSVITFEPANKKLSQQVATNLGCPVDSTDLMTKCVKSKSAQEVINASNFRGWTYEVEYPGSEQAFISEDPRVLLKEGRFNRVPLLTGLNANEAGGNAPIEYVELAKNYQEIYQYIFNYFGRYTKGKYDENGKPVGQSHGDELIYLFVTDRFPIFSSSDPENVMVQKLTGWWSQFAKTGNPNNPEDPWTSSYKWEPTTPAKSVIFKID